MKRLTQLMLAALVPLITAPTHALAYMIANIPFDNARLDRRIRAAGHQRYGRADQMIAELNPTQRILLAVRAVPLRVNSGAIRPIRRATVFGSLRAIILLAGLALLSGCDKPSPLEPATPQVSRPARWEPLSVQDNAASDLKTELAELRRRIEVLEAALASASALPPMPVYTRPGDIQEIPSSANAPPPRGRLLTDSQRVELLSDRIAFRPGSIQSSGVVVEEHTPLQLGQDLQVRWSNTWWAAVITGFESDGRIRIRYFGWGDYPEETVPRSSLQLDASARQSAVDGAYVLPR